ncbi:hypothetical protein J3459_003804 [Metarhizium acridum]|uniref:uncharacterized protein n=1 Tax=Metarhizium acridum TaxID=92637 RepID=UPI001C6C766E|nr:hypothetical protein J3458_002738 [Metarhizium acridum]KAG8428519.1 hypothetical protein J3459_003835 [Metarhizium acridum]KAG8428558.1 hypothetical protein J3459_003804 [Metarhizium acridum]
MNASKLAEGGRKDNTCITTTPELTVPSRSQTWASSSNPAWLGLLTQSPPFDCFGHDTGGIGAAQRGNPDDSPDLGSEVSVLPELPRSPGLMHHHP